ncbi:MAG: helix-turn-helix transcriptional regulator [Halobacteriovoraceae bacterium]|nr:helix-turn-helix transcriptional regulator [Halobacteriovoraceae bacterium]
MSIRKKNLSLGEFLRAHRQGEGLTQTAFAKSLGISKQRLCDIEANRFNASIKFCKSLAKKLDLPSEWLVKLALQHQFNKEGLKLKVG